MRARANAAVDRLATRGKKERKEIGSIGQGLGEKRQEGEKVQEEEELPDKVLNVHVSSNVGR